MKIEVSFIDVSTGKVFGQSSMHAQQLPETFARDTKIDIAGQPWHVVKAEPLTAQEFIRTGKLVLTVEKMVRMAMPAEK